jgi:hypothetical protein
LGFTHEILGFTHEILDLLTKYWIYSRNIGFTHEILGFTHEILGFTHEILDLLTLCFDTEFIYYNKSVTVSREGILRNIF